MWVVKYVVCLIRRHVFAAIFFGNSAYQYCLRCGKLELQKVAVPTDAGATRHNPGS